MTVTAYVLALGVVMRGLSGASGAQQIAARHTAFLIDGLGAAAVALFAPRASRSEAKSG